MVAGSSASISSWIAKRVVPVVLRSWKWPLTRTPHRRSRNGTRRTCKVGACASTKPRIVGQVVARVAALVVVRVADQPVGRRAVVQLPVVEVMAEVAAVATRVVAAVLAVAATAAVVLLAVALPIAVRVGLVLTASAVTTRRPRAVATMKIEIMVVGAVASASKATKTSGSGIRGGFRRLFVAVASCFAGGLVRTGSFCEPSSHGARNLWWPRNVP